MSANTSTSENESYTSEIRECATFCDNLQNVIHTYSQCVHFTTSGCTVLYKLKLNPPTQRIFTFTAWLQPLRMMVRTIGSDKNESKKDVLRFLTIEISLAGLRIKSGIIIVKKERKKLPFPFVLVSKTIDFLQRKNVPCVYMRKWNIIRNL